MKNKLNNSDIKKYPVFYQGEEYEIRIEKYYTSMWVFDEYITIYKVTKHKNWFGKEKTSYDLVYSSINLADFNWFYGINLDPYSETYYVDSFKKAFDLYLECKNAKIKKDEGKAKQLAALENWDGVIS